MAHLWTLPNNKIVEDIHQPLRLNARGNSNRRLSFRNIHDAVLGSGVLEKRDIRHICAVDKTTWARRFKSTKKKIQHRPIAAASTNSHLRGVAL